MFEWRLFEDVKWDLENFRRYVVSSGDDKDVVRWHDNLDIWVSSDWDLKEDRGTTAGYFSNEVKVLYYNGKAFNVEDPND